MVNLTGIKNLKKSFSFVPLKQRFNQRKKLSFEEEQSQALRDIGHKLKMFRDKNSICLEKVSVVTMIRINLLEAIEEGNLEKLPEPVYIQGMIKRYADAMGLDGEELAKLFPTAKTQEITKKSFPNVSMFQLRPYHLYFLYVLLVILSVRLLPYVISSSYILGREKGITNSEKQQYQAENEGNLLASVSPENRKTEQKSSAQTTTEKLEKKNQKQPVVLSVIVKEESWVSIEIDGKIAFEGTLAQGTQKSWSAQKQLVFWAGNAGGIFIPINNGQNMQLGKLGEVKQVVFTPTNTQISHQN
ncbi:MAG: helix-turn-helix domain-containing protein [Okeania sp. SIO3I5]|uniref:helix-turn-helix domain-containing protein n=1 Tax=Okeania sp. SIO3I5 TaxID=2607805 RepID=UPI0013BE059F|nr:RodZ domain-containing protein [Okeania sp. SIO3I5]NEQ37889.1 helix-turn-helix domain-containing protein [Okeania sp. SIO3I5]